MSQPEPGFAALPMYEMPETREPLQSLWSGVSARLGLESTDLSFDYDEESSWVHPRLILGQTCGWPLITTLAARVTVVGAFHHGDGDGDGDLVGPPSYRSVLVAARPGGLGSFEGGVGAINSRNSLSGCISLAVALADHSKQRPFFARVVETGSHLASLAAVATGEAAIASIDAVSYGLALKFSPELTDPLVIVGSGPSVPTLPLITASADPEPVRAALADTLSDPTAMDWMNQLLITGFSPVDLSDYQQLAKLGPIAAAVLGVESSDLI